MRSRAHQHDPTGSYPLYVSCQPCSVIWSLCWRPGMHSAPRRLSKDVYTDQDVGIAATSKHGCRTRRQTSMSSPPAACSAQPCPKTPCVAACASCTQLLKTPPKRSLNVRRDGLPLSRALPLPRSSWVKATQPPSLLACPHANRDSSSKACSERTDAWFPSEHARPREMGQPPLPLQLQLRGHPACRSASGPRSSWPRRQRTRPCAWQPAS